MRFRNLYARTAVLASLVVGFAACQSAQKPVALLPPTAAPALKPAPQSPPAPATPSITAVEPAPQESETQKAVPAQATAPAQSAPAPDPVAELIEQVEKEYEAGLDDYHASKNEEAKQHFDNALNALLGSKFDIRSDPRLQDQFNRVVQGVNDAYPGGPAQAEA